MDKYNGDLITKGRERSNSESEILSISFCICSDSLSCFLFIILIFNQRDENKERGINALQGHIQFLLLTHFICRTISKTARAKREI